ncbi:unnamed protein product [Toxocara canis]|uniref:Transposase n=1 Tax=Toxocara canis TaxID=6265 RepID=A0A183V1Q3_TOXCA|nr:unnamed protein product [Toxocara canis]
MNSVVIRMVKAINVSKFEMVVHIFDLDHRSPFRQTELSASRSDQELIVQTKNSSRYDQSIVNERIVTIDTMIVERSHMYIAVKSVFPNAEKVCAQNKFNLITYTRAHNRRMHCNRISHHKRCPAWTTHKTRLRILP